LKRIEIFHLHKNKKNVLKLSLYCDAWSDASTSFGAPTPSSGSLHDHHELPFGAHYRKNNGISSEVAPMSNFALWMEVDMVHRCWK
jgi:hypothetical protein